MENGMKRVEFLKAKWKKEVNATAKRVDHSFRGDGDAFEVLLAADPTAKKLYTEFVMRTYCAEEFLLEDVERVAETLSLFHSNKRNLPVDQRDIGTYKSERDVWRVLNEAGIATLSPSGKESKRSDRNRAFLESDVLRESGWTMATLNTPFSAKWWGMGTRWCTTAAPTFQHYAIRGKLRVFVSPDGIKHQLHIATGSLCDATDSAVDMAKYLKVVPKSFLDEIRKDVSDICKFFETGDIDAHANHVFTNFHTLVSRIPRSLFGEDIKNLESELVKVGIQRLRILAEEEGWSLKAQRCSLSAWALCSEGGLEYTDHSRYLQMLRIEAPELGICITCDGASLDKTQEIIPIMPPRLRERLLMFGIKAIALWRQESVRILAGLVAQTPPEELTPQFWMSWSKRVVTQDEAVDVVADIMGANGILPSCAWNEGVATAFAKKGLRKHIPDHLLTPAIAAQLAKREASFLNDDDIAPLLDENAIADAYGTRNGERLEHLPPEMRTPGMARLIVERQPGALKATVSMVLDGFFDLEGQDASTLAENLTHAALHKSVCAIHSTDIPLPYEVYMDAVKRDPGLMGRVPLEFRDKAMCLAAAEVRHTGNCHFPKWVADELKAAGHLDQYTPSARYASVLIACEKPTGTTPDKLPPFNIRDVEVPPTLRR